MTQIAKDKVVTVTYDLSSNLPGENKEHVETADEKHPLKFLFGSGMMIPGFEKGLEGKTKGDSFSFVIDSIDAYGDLDSQAVIKLPIDIFKVDGVVDFKLLTIGNTLPLNDNEGNVLNGTVRGYDESTVTMDFNHPLAGHQLHFSGKVVDVRDASAEEISHGHVH
jgi:FKBP-type peptidyl-prolyl cis-trans isomerase SlyD